MNERVKKLRAESISKHPFICAERAELVTDFFIEEFCEGLSIPVIRAKMFEYIIANRSICISDGELIVGERG